ncbi:response regulator [Comamonas sp. J-3]|uniref:response regulator n=1 Tax=Comamonas trifloxystrobinivorans TaxID=3350256 RepID=UPI00372CE412
MHRRLRTYLVEDNKTIRENLIATLEDLAEIEPVGYASTETNATAWLANNAEAWDLAIVDIFLLEGSGLGVLERLRKRAPEQHLVVLSNYATPSIRERCTQLGANQVFDKSQDIDALIDYCAERAMAIR